MRIEEARELAKIIGGLDLPQGTVCLNIGSSTRHFRQIVQPHIQSELIRPLEKTGLRFVHVDLKKEDGVDEIGDILDRDFRSSLKGYRARLLICSNLLEHLTDPLAFTAACAELVEADGYVILSVPSSYPKHSDPIDTLLRPSPDELAAMLPEGWSVVRSSELETGDYRQDLRASPHPFRALAYQLARTALPLYRPKAWRENAERLLWLFRPYRVSIVLAVKSAGRCPEFHNSATEHRAGIR